MISKTIKTLFVIFALGATIAAQAQSLPTLEKSKEIATGTLPNGIEYYIASNPNTKGFADFALVSLEEDDSTIIPDTQAPRAFLNQLDFFGSRVPYRFFAETSGGYSRHGNIERYHNAVLWRFPSVPTYKSSISDSTILAIMNIAAQSRNPKAVIIAGDANPSQIQEKLRLFSMLVPQLDNRQVDSSYSWKPSSNLASGYTRNYSGDIAAIYVNYKSARTSTEYLNTAVSLVTQSYAYILGELISSRISKVFSDNHIALVGQDFRYLNSSQTFTDEYYSFAVYCQSSKLSEANSLISSILSQIDSQGVSAEEFEAARNRVILNLRREIFIDHSSDEDYLRKCLASYLWNSDLAPRDVLINQLSFRRLALNVELPIFNDFASSLLDSKANLTLRYDVPSDKIDKNTLAREFEQAWTKQASYSYETGLESLRLPKADSRTKINSESSEPISGGQMWTFANGIRVIYKKLPTQAQFHYALMLRGGSPAVSGIKEGEAPFITDMLRLSNIAGVSGSAFFEMLSSNGISLSTEANLSELRLCGLAPSDQFGLVIKSLLAIANDRHPSKDAFDQYRKAQSLISSKQALYPLDIQPVLDSLIRPGFAYSSQKNIKRLQNDLPDRVERYFASTFSKVNDGLLIIVGDLDEEKVRRELSSSIGQFATTRKITAQKTKITSRYINNPVRKIRKARSGVLKDRERGAYIELSAPLVYNNANIYAFEIASQFLRDKLVKDMADKGAYVQIEQKMESLPSERASLYISCRPCIEYGLPLGITAAESREMMAALVESIKGIKNIALDKDRLKARKDQLLLDFDSRSKNPKSIIDDVIMRYGGGKDLVSGGKAAINSIDEIKVKEVLSLLVEGARAEVIVE